MPRSLPAPLGELFWSAHRLWIRQLDFRAPGKAAVKKYYGQANQDNKVKELEQISKIYPEVKNLPENLGAGHEWAMHTLTTPIIEIAGDGKTAKAVWYSPRR